jgi:hypothetical protein
MDISSERSKKLQKLNLIIYDKKIMKQSMTSKIIELFKISGIPVILASLCCLSPVVLVLLGVSTVSFASSLADTFYGMIALIGSLAFYLRRTKGICTIDDVVRRRNEVINYLALTVIAGVLGYLFFLYVVVHYLGVWLTLWK